GTGAPGPPATTLPRDDHLVHQRARGGRGRFRHAAGARLGELLMNATSVPEIPPSRASRPGRRRKLLLAAAALAWLVAMAAAFRYSAAGGFTWHMALHLLNVTAIAPLAAFAVRHGIPLRAPIPLMAAFAEFVVVWAWHAPAAHAFARDGTAGFLLEQASFVAGA